MITLPNHWFVQPRYKDYVLFANDKLIPWKLRARLINLYRRQVRKEEQPVVQPQVFVSKIRRPRIKLKPRHTEKPRKEPGSKKNSFVCNLLKVVIRWASSGKGRTSRKKKVTFRTKPLTIHLEGNKYNGGFRFF